MRGVARVAGGLVALALLCGCDRGFFRANGVVASDGGGLGRWSQRPQGCSRDAVNGTPVVASFFWEDTYDTHGEAIATPREESPDAPLELDLWRDAGRVRGRLQTANTAGTGLDGRVCSRLEVTSEEAGALYRDGRPTLRGRVKLDCRVNGSHVTGDFSFERCEY